MKKAKWYGGQGPEYSPEIGKYEVKAGGDKTKTFNKLSEAVAYYENLKEEKALWDITAVPELLIAHFVE